MTQKELGSQIFSEFPTINSVSFKGSLVSLRVNDCAPPSQFFFADKLREKGYSFNDNFKAWLVEMGMTEDQSLLILQMFFAFYKSNAGIHCSVQRTK